MSTVPDKTIFDDEIINEMDDATHASIERPLLLMLEGADVNARYFIDKPEMTIGRDRTCDIPLPDSRCSRRHARIIFENFPAIAETPKLRIQDLNSTNGIFVNGQRVTETEIVDRDKILMGSSLLGFFLRDESELAAEERLYHLAINDALTGLRNRHFFNREIDKEFERARRYKRSLTMLLFDIDHFKKFNDTYGHQTGDYVLSELGSLVQANVRGNDIAARYGGEEFAIILPETSLEGALIQAERLRVAVEKHPFTHDETRLQITISLGLATIEACQASHVDMIASADRALYLSKREGRNAVSWSRNGREFLGTEAY